MLPNWVGDAVMATPAIKAIRHTYPNAFIVGVGRNHIINELLDGSPWFDCKITLCKKILGKDGFRQAHTLIRKFYPDIAVLFTSSLRATLLAYQAKCKYIVGFKYKMHSFMYHKSIEYINIDKSNLHYPIIKNYNNLAMAIGTDDPGYKMYLYTNQYYDNLVSSVWKYYNLYKYANTIMIHASAAYGSAKRWPLTYFAYLSKWITHKFNSAVFVLHGPEDRLIAQKIVQDSRCQHIYYLDCNITPSLSLTKSLIKRASVLISTDSGPRHVAAALGCPVIALFGSTSIECTETYYPYGINLQNKVMCSPCQNRTCRYYHHYCMQRLLPNDIKSILRCFLSTYGH